MLTIYALANKGDGPQILTDLVVPRDTLLYFRCDTTADFPAATHCMGGDLAYVKANGRLYYWDNDTEVWRQLRY